MDYTVGCVNFRDVGEFVNLIAGEALLPEGRLLRGGQLGYVKEAAEIGSPGTIVNFRGSADPEHFQADLHHFPTPNTMEAYNTKSSETQRWLNRVLALFERDDLRYPVMVHCLSGKDRTGVAVAAILLVLGVPEEVIVQEYLLSEGNISEPSIRQALAGIGNPREYFRRVDLERVKRNILG